jgi:hypothetical protein
MLAKMMGTGPVCCSKVAVVGVFCETMRSGCCAISSLAKSLHRLRVARAPAIVDLDIAAPDPAKLLEAIPECGDECLKFGGRSRAPPSARRSAAFGRAAARAP